MNRQTETDPLIGTLFAGRYLINFLVARGGMGNIYQAHDVQSGQIVALKMLRAEYNHDPIIVRRFERETDVVAKLKHPNICQMYDCGCTPEGLHYFTMEYLDGEALDTMIKKERTLSPLRAVDYMIQAAAGLCDAHNHGIIHRDLKPANLFIIHGSDQTDFIKLLDFGIAKIDNYEELNERLTNAGTTLGTPYYMSPEQIQGFDVDARTDIYALGIIFWECLFGTPPFIGRNLIETFKATLKNKLPKLPSSLKSDPIWRKIYKVLQKALKKDKNKRYASIQAFMHDLEAIRSFAEQQTPTNETPKSLPSLHLKNLFHRPVNRIVLASILLSICLAIGIIAFVCFVDWPGDTPAEETETQQAQFETYKFITDIPASVMHDGKLLGTTPLSVDLTDKPPFTVILMAPGVADFPITIDSTFDGVASYAVNLKPTKSDTPSIKIESIPPNAEVFALNPDAGGKVHPIPPVKTPCEFNPGIEQNDRQILTIKLPGYKTETITVFSNGGDMTIKTNLFRQ